MLLRFSDNVFNDNYLCTIGVDFKIKTLRIDKRIIKMQIWDTAGQERFRSISHAYYRNSHGCVAVYDIANRASFESIEEQIQSFISYSAQDVARNIILVGNKTDLSDRRKVTFDEAIRLGKKLNLAGVYETSAKNNSSIDDAFFHSIVNCLDFNYLGDDSTVLGRSTTSRSRKYSAPFEERKGGGRSFRASSA
jgi:small GTP-binding protein